MGRLMDTLMVIGASGFLGRALCNVPASDFRRVPVSRSRHHATPGPDGLSVDVGDPDQVKSAVDEVRPRWVINTVAVTSVDRCESEPDLARRVHVDGTRNLARACEAAGCGLIALSTNYVFDGAEGPYGEKDRADPVNVYGQTKLAGEAIALGAECPSVVVRTAVLYGYPRGSRPNFVTWAAGCLAQGKAIRVVTDEWANPTFVDELALFLIDLCRQDFQGLVHFAGPEYLTRYEMVQRVSSAFGLDEGLVTSVTSSELEQRARRPPRAGLQVHRCRALFSGRIATFDENLRQLAGAVPDPALLVPQ